jgi:hypothetical protein
MAIGNSSSDSPYILPFKPNVRFTSIITVGDPLPADGVFAGKADGIGAFDNGDGTITVLVNHELSSSAGLLRDHGSTGAFIDRLVIDKATLTILSADDLIQTVFRWDDGADSYVTRTTAFSRLCSSDLAAPSAFFDPATGTGTDVRIYLTGEESSSGRAFGTVVTGPNAGTAYELPYFGNMAFENAVANPFAQKATIVALTDDAFGGQVYFYVGEKRASGSDIEKAGLTEGALYGLRVTGIPDEEDGAPANGTFTLEQIGPGGDASNMSASQIEDESDDENVTGFLRPEDCAWDPDNPNVLYFNVTNHFSDNSRLYQVTFIDIRNPLLGGTIRAVLDGSEGQHQLDNLTVAGGKVILQEDPGDRDYLSTVWEYDIASDTLVKLAAFDPARFTSGGSDFITADEEGSGIIDVTALLGDSNTRAYLLTAQLSVDTGDPSTVQPGQLLAMFVDSDPPPTPPDEMVVNFRNGDNYSGTVDTSINRFSPDRIAGAATTLFVDTGSETDQALLVFNSLFGSGPGQIPFGATITNATLTLNTVNSSPTGASLHRMVAGWTEQSTWNSLFDGVQIGTQAVLQADLVTGAVGKGLGSFDVTASLNAWLSGAATADEANAANQGWVFVATSSDGWDFSSSESSNAPMLTVTYALDDADPDLVVTIAADDDLLIETSLPWDQLGNGWMLYA